ncbi:MAG: putative selenium-dependent hydroxylase accessory protein YqeC [Gemmatimonadota bacterium]|nr:MAG: putative selenium-dependent hydroxylase accessory protein YqeC [Gemmatimonadota bacterium]
MSELLDLLNARIGVICAVGAGGKKTTLYHLAQTHRGRVGITSTVPIAHFPKQLNAEVVIAGPDELATAAVEAAGRHRLVAFALPDVRKERFGGVEPALIVKIGQAAGFDLLLVKCDGARMRWIKAPQEGEPVFPDNTTTVIPIVSARAIGEPLTETIAHRLAQVEAVTHARYGEPVTPEHIARLLSDERGALKDVRDATVVPVINMVDSKEREARAVEAAEYALGLSDRFDRIVLTSHLSSGRLVATVTR